MKKNHAHRSSSRPSVVGIGASAGGVEALQRLFDAVPSDLGLAYVVVIHLLPERESELPEILRRHTAMPVTQVGKQESERLEPNRIYVISPDTELTISHDSVKATPLSHARGRRSAIDLFFRSLAANHGDDFAVILSGSGSDGAVGAKAVKEAGGLVMVQSPSEASHDSMPSAVIAAGVADIVAPVDELADELALLASNGQKHAAFARIVEQQAEMNDGDESAFRSVIEVLRRQTGHDFSKYKRSTILRRLARRVQLTHQTTLPEYLAFLRENTGEVQALFNDFLISVTMFFRDPEAWTALQRQVIVLLVEQLSEDRTIRAWVPGCATGEEAYALAILLRDEIQRRGIRRDFIIFATDVDEYALAIAREGVYPIGINTDVSAERLERYFHLQEDYYKVSREIRDCVVFARHNLLLDPPFSKLHLISCRNLLIYLDRELQEQVISLFHYAAQEHAYLFLGSADNAEQDVFRVIDKKHKIFQVLKPTKSDRTLLPSLVAAPHGLHRPEREPRVPQRSSAIENHLDALEAIGPPSLVIDERWNILHLSNSVGKYLQQRGGPYARQVIDAIRPELRDEAHRVLYRVVDATEPQLSAFVPVELDGTRRRVAVLASRHRESDGGTTRVLLTFLEAGNASDDLPPSGEDGEVDEVKHDLRRKLQDAERNVESMRDDRHLANEDLRVANEELQSLNEEYRSTTEELETSKEELQSVNEELHTVNNELKSKVEVISQAHNDLENLMAATSIPILFLDRDLQIKRITPQIEKIFNITSKDRGRPIGNFTHNLNYDSFEKEARAVLADLSSRECEVHGRDGRTFILRLAAYRTVDQIVDGVVATFVDVTDLLSAEEESRKNAEQFKALVDASAQIVWTADKDGREIEKSASWQEFTGQHQDGESASWLEAVHPADRQRVDSEWRASVDSGSVFADEFRIYCLAQAVYRWTAVRAVPLRQRDGRVRGWVGMHTDVTERREAEEALREADYQKDEFLAVLGHELRNPLAAISSSIAVHEVAEAETKDRAWEVIRRQTKHMTRLVNDLLDIVRFERGKLLLQRSKVNLIDCIQEVADAIEDGCRSAGLKLTVDLDRGPRFVDADPERLVQIFDNLLRNAMAFTETGGEITVTARKQDAYVVVSICDTGVGMEPSTIERLFEPYQQANSSQHGGGLGLGLTLVKQLVDMHGGSVAASSGGIGFGSEFQVTLPLVDPTVPAVRQGSFQMPARRSILLVDDDADVSAMLAIVLENLNQDVTVSNNGQAALEAARARLPEIALLDLSMPGMGGEELARRLREEHGSRLYIVALSGFGIESRKVSSDFDSHLLKPATVEKFAALLNSTGSARH